MAWLAEMPGWAAAAIGAAAVGLGAAALSAALRAARAPGGGGGAALLGGVFAGLLLGAGVLGAAAPGVFDPLLRGGVEERAALDDLRREHLRQMLALRQSGVTGVALDELAAEHAREREPLERSLEGAEAAHGERVGAFTLALAASAALLGWAARVGRPLSARRGMRREGAAAGAVSFAFGAAPGAAAVWWLTGESWAGALALGGAAGAGWIAPTLRARLEGEAARAVRVDAAQLVAFWLAASGALAGALLDGSGRAMALVLSAWGLAAGLALMGLRPAPAVRRAAWGLLTGVALPAMAALAVVRIEPLPLFSSWRFWGAGVLLLICATDLRFAGAWIGARLVGVRDAWGFAAAHVAGGGGIALASLGAALHAGGVVGGRAAMLALIAGALVEVSAGGYVAAARMMRRA